MHNFARKRHVGFICFIVLASVSARGNTSTSISISGNAYSQVSAFGVANQFFGGQFSCSAATPGGGYAGCSTDPTFYAPSSTGAYESVSVSGYAAASDGSIEFYGNLQAPGYRANEASIALYETASASYSYLLDFGGTDPSSIQLTFLAYNSNLSGPENGLETQHYSATLGDDPTWSFSPPDYSDVFTETFAIDPTAGSALLTVQGTTSGVTGGEAGPDYVSAGLTLQSVELLDANGNLIAAPEPGEMIPLGAGMILLLAWARRLRG